MTNTNIRKCVAVFVKSPQAGTVKTRLASEIGDQAAVELYKCFTEDVLTSLAKTSALVRLFYHPPENRAEIKSWLGSDYELIEQAGDGLGQRMIAAFRTCFQQGFSQVLLIGSDIPDLPARYVERAFELLKSSDAVIGPASDGGYYLIGFSKEGFSAEVFRDIAWSCESVLELTIQRMEDNRVHCALLPVWHDIDGLSDARSFFARNQHTACQTLKTMQVLSKILNGGRVCSLNMGK